MIIEKNLEGWSFSTDEHKNLWHLIFGDDKIVSSYYHAPLYTSTQANLFVGTKEECDQHIIDQNLILPVTEVTSEPYQPEPLYSSQDQ
jgi:hypothetical protein